MSKKSIFIGLSILLIMFWIFSADKKNPSQNESKSSNAVSQSGGEQRIKIFARGGYTPNYVYAEANKNTVLTIETKGTYDCSSSVAIPQLNYRNNLPATGLTNITIPASAAKDSLEILCSMGMYRATVFFSS